MKSSKEQVKQYLLSCIAANDKALVDKTVEYFGRSRSTVYNYLKELTDDGLILRQADRFELCSREHHFLYKNDGHLSESRLCAADFEPFLRGFEKNVISIWRYAYMEMMNNAIEHSQASEIRVTVRTDAVNTTVFIRDNGIGIFENIRAYIARERGEELPADECAAFLLTGKFTTAKSAHSGEGIFFTSHMMDTFAILSDTVFFTRDNFHDRQLVAEGADVGTLVVMSLSNTSKKTAREVFDRFSDVDDGFTKTAVPIAHVFPHGDPISRSEARRLGELIQNFSEIELDFSRIEEVGQAFVHELFVVWQRNHPNVTLCVRHACENVDFMIRRVLRTAE